jgi:hypothetical protein
MVLPLDDNEVKRLAIDLLKTPTPRTKQTRIGASGIGDPCPYCLVQALLANKQGQSQYWLGARIGDAIHKLLESEVLKHIVKPESYHFNALVGADSEKTIYLGNIPGYGDIWSTPDLYLPAKNHLIDWKTSKRDKSFKYYATGEIPVKYIYQIMLYARGLIAAGKQVDKVSFVFINRDGTSDRDVIVISFDYNEALADEAWDRLEAAWQWLEAGNDPETLPSDPQCYVCQQVIHRMGPTLASN